MVNRRLIPDSLVGDDVLIPAYATGAGYLIRSDVLPHLAIAIRHLNFIGHNEDVNVGKAMTLLNYNCSHIDHWVARYGCENRTSCLDYSIIHRNSSNTEIGKYWRYLL